jgi:hypothetical protein
VPGLSPIYGFNSVDAANGWTMYNRDTIDPRGTGQTHTALVALNDVWKLGADRELQLSGFFRTYNLSLYSDFGMGLIRQSEFRTVQGGSAAYVNKLRKCFTLFVGTDYEREAPRRDENDHYNFFNPADPSYYGPFVKVDENNVTIASVSPYIAGQGSLSRFVHYYLGWRRDEIFIDNQNLVTPANSWSKLVGVNSPKATITFVPEESWWVPQVALSFGKSFFTEDPRTGSATGNVAANGSLTTVDPVETARSYQLVASKTFHNTDLKLTLGHETQSAEYGKFDPDDGIQFDLGPGRILLCGYGSSKLPHWIAASDHRAGGCAPCRRANGIGDAGGSAVDWRSCWHDRKAALPFEGKGRIRVRGQEGGWDWMQRERLAQQRRSGSQLLLPRRAGQGVPVIGDSAFLCGKNIGRREHDDCQRLHGADHGKLRHQL